MAKKDLDGQLQAFFEHNPLDDGMIYLKTYVKEHPDNKMGWYLLGKEYAARNKPGKAKYCFAQAGEVYEAFEKSKVELGFLEELKADRRILPGQKGRRLTMGRSLRLAGALLAAILLGSYFMPGSGKTPAEQDAAEPNSLEGTHSDSNPSIGSPDVQIWYMNPAEKLSGEELWKPFLLSGNRGAGKSILVMGKLTSDGKWVNGLRMPAILASGRPQSDGTGLQVAYHQAELCHCTPENDADAAAEVEKWIIAREEALIVRSAVRAYLARYGEPLPAGLDGLVRDYPHNLLPGYTEGMKAIYAGILSEGGSGQTAAGGQQEGSRDNARRTGTEDGYLEAPLEILVDKASYRLALVSGSIILRSYPVGLGGSRTPDGVFHISDKVKNPNGRDDGDFGSRGMQLSDTDYAIHGTKEPRSIGENRSLGCIRMLKEDIEELYDMAPSGTKVTIGTGLLPADTLRKEKPFRMPALKEERNPNKIYRWL